MAGEKQPNEVAELKAQNAMLLDRLANLEKLVAMQNPVVAPVAQEMAREEEFERRKIELTKSCAERTQLEARRLWQEKMEYQVSVVPVKAGSGESDMPKLLIPAHSQEEAKGRYDKLCGINSVDPQVMKYEISKPVPAAQPSPA